MFCGCPYFCARSRVCPNSRTASAAACAQSTDPDVKRAAGPTQALGALVPPATLNAGLAELGQNFSYVFDNAINYKALVRAELTVGRSVFIVPIAMTQEALDISEVSAMIQNGMIMHVFLAELGAKELTGAGDGLRNCGWRGENQGKQIHATFADNRTAVMRVGADGSLTGHEMDAQTPAIVSGAELQKRTAMCTLLPNGHLEVGPVETKDFREENASRLIRQETVHEEQFEQPAAGGWAACVSTRTFVNDGSDQRYAAGADVAARSCILRRHRLDPALDPNDTAKHRDNYSVVGGYFISTDRSKRSFHCHLSEVPPSDPPEQPAPATEQLAVLVSRTAVCAPPPYSFLCVITAKSLTAALLQTRSARRDLHRTRHSRCRFRR